MLKRVKNWWETKKEKLILQRVEADVDRLFNSSSYNEHHKRLVSQNIMAQIGGYWEVKSLEEEAAFIKRLKGEE